MMNIKKTPRIITALMGFILCLSSFTLAAQTSDQKNNLFPKVQFETSLGNFTVELNRAKAPLTVNNFINYVLDGSYNGTIFHRVEADFVVQGGGYTETFEPKPISDPIFNESGNGLKNKEMTIAMARVSNPHSATRQFYFNLADNEHLDPGRTWGYAVFGYVESGEEVIEKLGKVETSFNPDFGTGSVPVQTVLIRKVTLLPQQ